MVSHTMSDSRSALNDSIDYMKIKEQVLMDESEFDQLFEDDRVQDKEHELERFFE